MNIASTIGTDAVLAAIADTVSTAVSSAVSIYQATAIVSGKRAGDAK